MYTELDIALSAFAAVYSRSAHLVVQNNFLENAQEHGLPQTLASMPVHLLTHSSMDQYLLQSHPFHFDSYVYSQVGSDTTPLEFNLERLTHLVAQNLASKRFITNTILGLHKNFCYKQPEVEDMAAGQAQQRHDALPAPFAAPLSPDQLNALRTHCSHVQLEELQQLTSVLDALSQLAAQLHDSQVLQELDPAGYIKNAAASLAGSEALQASTAQHQTASLFQKHGVQELQLAHLQPIRDFFLEQYHQQGYQFADVSPLLKAPLGVEQTAALKADLAHGVAQDVSNKRALTELVAALREAELDILPSQANQGASLRSVCEAWAYEADEFPVSVINSKLMCSQYVAVMRVMLQVNFPTALPHLADLAINGAVAAACTLVHACTCEFAHFTARPSIAQMQLPRTAPPALALVPGLAEQVFQQCEVDTLAVPGVARR